MAKLKPWYQVVTPREDLRENRPLDASEFAVHLDHIRERPGARRLHQAGAVLRPDLHDRQPARTWRARSCGGCRASRSKPRPCSTWPRSSAAASPTRSRRCTTWPRTATKAKDWKGVDGDSPARRASTQVPKADVAVLRGHGVRRAQGPWRRRRAGPQDALGRDRLAVGRREGVCGRRGSTTPRGSRPAGDVIRQMLPQGPVLILMDELLNYMSTRPQAGAGRPALQLPPQPGRGGPRRNNVVLCVSIPSSSDMEMNADDRRRLRGAQADARPAGQGDHDVGRQGDGRDHPPPAVRLARACPTTGARRRPPTRNGPSNMPRN